jgi:hypothetical protein
MLVEAAHLAAIALVVREPRRPAVRSASTSGFRALACTVGAGLRLAAARPPVRALVLAAAASGLAIGAIELLWQPRFAELLRAPGTTTEAFGVLATAAFLAAAAGSALAPRLVRACRGRLGVCAAGTTAARGFAMLALAVATPAAPAALAFTFTYLVAGATGPLHRELLHDRVAARERATMVSADSLALMLGGGVASGLLGWAAASAGVGGAWTLAGAVVVLSGLLYLRVDRASTAVDRPGTPDRRSDAPARATSHGRRGRRP